MWLKENIPESKTQSHLYRRQLEYICFSHYSLFCSFLIFSPTYTRLFQVSLNLSFPLDNRCWRPDPTVHANTHSSDVSWCRKFLSLALPEALVQHMIWALITFDTQKFQRLRKPKFCKHSRLLVVQQGRHYHRCWKTCYACNWAERKHCPSGLLWEDSSICKTRAVC